MQLQPLVQGQDAFQRIKTVRDLTKPKQDVEYFDLDGQKVEVSPKDKFNLVVDSATGLAARVIYGKVVLEKGEETALPFGMERAEIEGSFGEKSTGNIFVDSRGSQSNSDDSVAILSKNTVFDETSARNIVVNSPDSRFIDAMENRVVRSGSFGVYLSHNNRVKDSAGAPGRVDVEKTDDAYMNLSNGPKLRKIVTSDPRTLIINIDGAKIKNSEGAQVISSELIEVTNSPGVYAELASGGTVIKNSPLAFLYNANTNDKDGASVVRDSKLASVNDANYVLVEGSPSAVLKAAHYARVSNSPRVNIKQSLHVHASNSGDSRVDKSNRALLENSSGSEHVTSEGSKSVNSPGSAFNNADAGTIRDSENASVTDSYHASIVRSKGGRIYDAEEGKLVDSEGTRLEVGRHTSVKGVVGKAIIDRPNEKFTAKAAASLPDAKSPYKSRPGISKPVA